jgi:hypothetical protein
MFAGTKTSLIAGAVFSVVIVAAYAISTKVEGAIDEGMISIPAIPAAGTVFAPAAYFPSQYVNEAKEIEKPVETF